jgi:hypothetical protein
VTGRFLHLSYRIKDGAKQAPPLQICRTYTDIVVQRGGQRLWERVDGGWGGTTAVLAPAEAGDKGAIYVQVDVKGGGKFYDVYIVEESPKR